MRLVTLLPAAMEIVTALGAADSLVGISHECDYPIPSSRRASATSAPWPTVRSTV
jgi:iron complex transport system substrate-binding protein